VTDKDYREQKRRVKKYIDKWFRTLGLGWFSVDMEWSREKDNDTAARTLSSWQYKNATITWFLPLLAQYDDDTVERTVVHEFCHVLLSGLAQNQQNTDESLSSQVNEYTTELVANALVWARVAGEDKK
jgi:hypothetical protein